MEEPVEAVNNETTPRQEKAASSTPQPEEKQPEALVVADPAPEEEPEAESESESKPRAEPQTSPAKSSPMKRPAAPVEEDPVEEVTHEKDDTPLDSLDDIGTPSDNSTPERPPIRKSSLSFASLPAREPLLKKSLGGSRLSRTSHVDIARVNNAAGPSSFGRQTGGHRNTAVDEEPALDDDMDIDEGREVLSCKVILRQKQTPQLARPIPSLPLRDFTKRLACLANFNPRGPRSPSHPFQAYPPLTLLIPSSQQPVQSQRCSIRNLVNRPHRSLWQSTGTTGSSQ
jgi:hypothetical protein